MAWFAASLLLPWLAAYVLVGCCDRAARHDWATIFLRLGLAVGVGVGLSSCGYFLWMFLVGPPGKLYHASDLTVCAAISLFGLVFRPAAATACNASELPSAAGLRWQRLLVAAFVAALTLAVLGAVGVYWRNPLGDWDAWAIWNLRARFLFRAGDQWQQAFAPMFYHPDYPLLVPSSNARLWSYLGAESTWAPWLLGVLFTLATVGVLTAGLWRLRSRSQGLLAGLAILGMVPFLQRGAWQYADVPLAFFILAAVLLLVLYDAAERPPAGLLLLSGLMAGLATWTKNEGLLLPIALMAARAAVLCRRRCVRQGPRELLCLLVGASPALAMLIIQKLCLNGDNDLVGNQTWAAALRQLMDLSRYGHITQALLLNALAHCPALRGRVAAVRVVSRPCAEACSGPTWAVCGHYRPRAAIGGLFPRLSPDSLGSPVAPGVVGRSIAAPALPVRPADSVPLARHAGGSLCSRSGLKMGHRRPRLCHPAKQA